MKLNASIDPVAECSILIRFDSDPSDHLSWVIGEISHYLSNQLGAWVMNVTPSFNTILVDYLPHRISIFEFVPYLEHLVTEALENMPESHQSEVITLPIYYDLSVGPDLALYQSDGVDINRFRDLHSQVEYTVGAIGFSAGFAFLTAVDHRIRRPRKASPRVTVPKGSVGIANNQTAIYPSESPGGWNIIGNCPTQLYHPDKAKVLPFSIGTKVRFESIDYDTFVQLGGKVNKDWDWQ